jgi:hypothetical protein
MMLGSANSTWSTIRNGWDERVKAEGWQVEQIPAGKGGCDPVGQGCITDRDSGVRGGMMTADEDAAEGGRDERSFRR